MTDDASTGRPLQPSPSRPRRARHRWTSTLRGAAVIAAVTAVTALAGCAQPDTPQTGTTEQTHPPVTVGADSRAADGWEDGWGAAPAADGGTFITGGFTGTASFGATTLTSNGGIDVFVAKIDALGNWQWAVSAGGPGDDEGYAVTTTADALAITGYFQEQATFGTTELAAAGGSDPYVAQLSSEGQWQWATAGGGTNYDRGRGISSDTNGNLYTTGWFWDEATFGPTTLNALGYGDLYVAKLDANGAWQWAVSGGGTGNDQAHGITVTTDGHIAVSGYFQRTAQIGDTELRAVGDYDAYVAKLDTNGTWQWAVSGGGTGYDRGLGLTNRTDGTLILAGFFYGDAAFGDTRLMSAGDGDIYIAELSPDGTWLRALRAGSFDYDEAYSAQPTTDGGAIVYGSIGGATAAFDDAAITSAGSDDIFIAKLDANGTWDWAVRAGGGNRDEGYAVTVDTNGDITAIGTIRDRVQFGAIEIAAQTGSDVFVARSDVAGNWQWVTTAGS